MGKLTRQILCIEDEAEMIELISLILERHNFKVTGALGGQKGLEALKTEVPDLILLDLMMPDMDGWDVYKRIKADPSLANIPVIVVTAKAQSIDKVLGLHIAKVEDYVTKPFVPDDLVASVSRVLGSTEIGLS